MLESQIQKKLIDQYEAEGYWVLKIIRANKAGIPDLLLINKTTGVASWVEVKTPKGRISKLQRLRAQELRRFCKVSFLTVNGTPIDEGEPLPVLEF